MDQALIQIQENLDSIKSQSKKGTEFWSARALMKTLEYTTWAKFQDAIKRAKESCRRSGESIDDHFAASSKMVLTGSGAHRKIEDIYLTRYACYLIAQNGDPRKPQIALAQTYFATQTRKQELLENRERENKRLEAREKLKETEKKIESTVYKRGIRLPVEFGTFKSKHIEALYGGISVGDLKKRKGMPMGRALADFDTDLELRAKDFVLAMTDHNIKQKNLQGTYQMTEEVIKNSKATRQTLISRDIKPENFKAQEDLRLVESRRKKELKAVEELKKLK